MISWIQRYFQHHFRIVFGLVLLATIVSFIIAFGPGSNMTRAGQRTITREFFGYNLGSPDDQSRLFGDANLSATLQTGYSSLENADLQNYGLQRAAALALADQYHLPATTNQEITDFIKNLRAFAGEDGQFDAARYGTFRDSLKTNPRMTEGVVRRVLADDVRVEKVKRILAGPGYVLPADVKAQLDRADSVWTVGIATADYASFNPSIPVTEATLAKYLEDNSFRYTIPARVVATCAYFPAAAYAGAVTVNDAEVRAYYAANPGRFPNPAAKPAPAKPDPAADYAAVRPQVEAALRQERAQRVAAKTASDLSFALYDGKIVVGTPAFDALLAAQKVTLKPLAPFTREEGPAEFGGSAEIAAEAFKLGPARAYTDALAAPEGAVVLFWKDTLPPRQPQLAEVRVKVAADCTENEKLKRFVEFGRTLRSLIENRLRAGDGFEKAVADAAGATAVKLSGKVLPPFTRRTPPPELDNTVAGALDRLEKGRLTDMSVVKDHGVFVYAADKKLPDLSESGAAYAAMRAQLAMVNARIGANSHLAELVAQELRKSEPPVR
jgi:peptidyl-prolyl cis-trans isomerase D